MANISDANQDFFDLMASMLKPDPSLVYFGMNVGVDVISVDVSTLSFDAQTVITSDEIGIAGTLDEGWVATVTDNLTSPLMVVAGKGMPSVTTSLSTKALCPIKPGTRIIIENKMVSTSQPPATTTVFRDATTPEVVYATAQHTKFMKPELFRDLRSDLVEKGQQNSHSFFTLLVLYTFASNFIPMTAAPEFTSPVPAEELTRRAETYHKQLLASNVKLTTPPVSRLQLVSIKPTGAKGDRVTSAFLTFTFSVENTDCNTWGTIHGGCVFTLFNAAGKIATACGCQWRKEDCVDRPDHELPGGRAGQLDCDPGDRVPADDKILLASCVAVSRTRRAIWRTLPRRITHTYGFALYNNTHAAVAPVAIYISHGISHARTGLKDALDITDTLKKNGDHRGWQQKFCGGPGCYGTGLQTINGCVYLIINAWCSALVVAENPNIWLADAYIQNLDITQRLNSSPQNTEYLGFHSLVSITTKSKDYILPSSFW
ncbi:hypothetical protein DL89DRAFT_281376 [Linderina pennispora]|uniref:Thioesterase domain-containing protein n=1 Tax=Linderina pennispora TaxID=61395 RepID=A0A1Y1WHP0_9FUNG|nr:uncharacterized protein DL89DRAFT_281376 [Linderina pennispora]ORX72644.1 hypothetical protein DL89DRAFT_281376 [Linderina pennispora]